jgi:hypothetical protein
MANNSQLRGTPVSATASGAGTAVVILNGVAGQTYHITDVSGSSAVPNGGGTWTILSGATGTTILWQGAGNVNEDFTAILMAPTGGTVSFYMNGTSLTYVNIAGYLL